MGSIAKELFDVVPVSTEGADVEAFSPGVWIGGKAKTGLNAEVADLARNEESGEVERSIF